MDDPHSRRLWGIVKSCNLWQGRDLTELQLSWAAMNYERDQAEADREKLNFFRILLGIVHGNPERTAVLLYGGNDEIPIDPDFEAEANRDLWWGDADPLKGVEWFGWRE